MATEPQSAITSKVVEQARKLAERKQRETLEQLELFLPQEGWGDSQRGVPNGLLRSAIFGAVPVRGKAAHLTREPMASVEGVEILYTGIRLSQLHLTLWGNLVHIAREHQLGNKCVTSIYQLLKLQGKKDTGGNRETLYKQLAELQATAVEVKQGRYIYSGSFIDEAYRDSEIDRLIIVLNPRIISLFAPDQYTRISWRVRMELTSPTALWLHGFYSSHDAPYAYKVSTIQRLCGSKNKSASAFQTITLAEALQELRLASIKHEIPFFYAIENKQLFVSHEKEIEFKKPR